MKTGKVYLIGAGPGDPDLITLKAVKALNTASVVLVDDLVNRDILNHAPTARVIEVGKRGGCKSTPQHFINRMMIALAQQGEIVVRLKGGDPFLFGRGGEEMLALRAAGIEPEIISGITSGIGAPATIGIPVTHRHYTHGVTFITGHTEQENQHNWEALANTGTTLVIYMGMARLQRLVREMLSAGYLPSTPVAAIQHGTLPNQQQLISTLSALPHAIQQAGLGSPAILVVGDVVKLAKNLPLEQVIAEAVAA